MKNETECLKADILALQNKSVREFETLKDQFIASVEMLRPINLLKSTFQEVTTSPEMKDAVVNSLTGMTAGFFTKKIFVGSSRNPLTRMFGTMIQFATASLVSKHVVDIKTISRDLISRFLTNRKEKRKQALADIANLSGDC